LDLTGVGSPPGKGTRYHRGKVVTPAVAARERPRCGAAFERGETRGGGSGMDAERTLEVVTAVWGLAMAVSPGLQIRQMLRTGESEDVSIGYFAVLSVGFALWAAYGVTTGVPILYLCNSVA